MKMRYMANAVDFKNSVASKDVRAVYYLITFLSDFAVSTTSAIYVLFLLSQGLDLLQVNLVNLCFMLGNFIFEIPTGVYADYFGRKRSVILSGIFVTLALGTYYFSSTIFMFILAESFAALAFTFESGALDAWVVDSLSAKGYIGKVDFVFSHASIVGRVAGLLGGLVGAYLGSSNLRTPLGFGALISILAVVVTILFMHEDREVKREVKFSADVKKMFKVAREGMGYGLKHKVILWLIFSSILATFAFQPLNMYWSPRLNALSGDKVWLMGWVWAFVSVFMMSGSILGKHFAKKGKSYLWILVFTALVLSLPILGAAMFNTFAIVLSGFLTYEIGRGMIDPVTKSYMNKHIQSEQRATVLSFASMMSKLGAAGGLVALGWVAKNYSIQDAWLISGILLLFLIPIYLKVTEKEKAITN